MYVYTLTAIHEPGDPDKPRLTRRLILQWFFHLLKRTHDNVSEMIRYRFQFQIKIKTQLDCH